MARPKEFEPQEALDKAMRQFWAKGYHDTSIRDLTARTGVNQYGLYGVFGNKLGLYLSALDRYRDTVTAEALEMLRVHLAVHHVVAPLTQLPEHRHGRDLRRVLDPDGTRLVASRAHRRALSRARRASGGRADRAALARRGR